MTELPPGHLMRPLNILSREMRSKAPTPSIDKMVASGCCSVRACTACATHSHPAFVVSAYWNGAVAASTASLICCAIVRATTLLITSPATMPLTPPDGFCRAVSLPILTMSLMELGTAPLARSSDTTKSDCVSRFQPESPNVTVQEDAEMFHRHS